MSDPTQRFSNRVTDYTRYRPGYPAPAVAAALGTYGSGADVADVGSGTGLFTRALLDQGCRVWAVEPNTAMRSEAENLLASYPGFTSVKGTSEATGLTEAGFDVVTAAQSFHWFDRARARREFQRLLRPGGHVALIWNKRLVDSPFLQGYEALVTPLPGYAEVSHHNVTDEVLRDFFGRTPELTAIDHAQEFDFEGVLGRLSSSSYCPAPGTDAHAQVSQRLRALFDQQRASTVSIRYRCEVYTAPLRSL